jgi:putative ABC transport system substrate-binding protein
MERREFITLLGGAAGAWPLAARAQHSSKLPTIGFLGPVTAAFQKPWVDAFVQRLHELGWIEGRSIAIEYRWGEGRPERFAEIAAEFVRLKVDIIVTSGTHGLVKPIGRSGCKEARAFARGYSHSPPHGDHLKCRQPGRRAGEARGSNSCPRCRD